MKRCTFLLILVCLLAPPVRAAVPTPESHFGHPVDADRKVLDWDKVVSYFRALQQSSDRLQVRELGKSTGGRPFITAIISSAETLRNLDRYRAVQQRLADPRGLPAEQAEALFRQGKAVVMITCSVHSTEIASTHTAVLFAYRMLAEQNPKFRAILDNVIFLLVPSLNPDGVDLVTNWYRKTLGTPFEGTSPPELYQKYIGHDNNRDWYIFSQQETRLAVAELHNVWHPQIVYDVHQMGPATARIFVPPWMDPFDPNIDPLLVQMCNAIGMGMAMDLTAAGLKGVAVNAIYDFWTPARHYQAYHGGMRLLSESASVRIATPVEIQPSQLDYDGRGYNPAKPSWNHVEPWPGGMWRLADLIQYQMVAWESCLYQAATRREDLLRNFHRLGKTAASRTDPFAFAIPANQPDPGATRRLLATLRFGQVEIGQTREDAALPGARRLPAGSWLIRMQQPYSSWAKTLLEAQRYPDLRAYPGGPPKPPYDVTAHTLPMLFGVQVETLREPVQVATAPVTEFAAPATPSTGRYAATDTDSWVAVNRAWARHAAVYRHPQSGDFWIGNPPPGEWRRAARPRIGLYRSHVPSMDEGWTRWLLEQFGFAYTSVRNEEIRGGGLDQRYDVIVFPDQPARQIAEGYRPGAMPEEFIGGLGEVGFEALRQFARAGGRLVFLNESTGYALRFGLSVKDVTQGLNNRQLYCPGSLLQVRRAQTHPVLAGLPAEFPIWMEHSPAFEITGEGARSLLDYPSANLLASGWLLGEDRIASRSALVEASLDKGAIVLFGMRPQYRGQSYLTAKLFFNALVSW